MASLRLFFHRLLLTPTEAAIVLPALAAANRKRLLFVAFLGPAVNLLHIVLFALSLTASRPEDILWRWQIIASHGVLLVVFVAAGALSWRRPEVDRPLPPGLFHGVYAILLASGVAIALIDQQVTTAVTPYLVASLALPLVLQVAPPAALAYHAAAFVAFATGLWWVQPDAAVRLSNQVNGITGLALGLGLSVALWSLARTNFLQLHQIDEQNKELLALNQTKDRFFSIIAHDLRGPFSGMIGVMDFLLDPEVPPRPNEVSEGLLVLRDTAVSLYRLMDNLLLWAKAQRGLIELHPDQVAVLPFLTEAAQTLAGLARTRGVFVEVSCPDDLTLRVDRAALDTVVRNLLSNALKFTASGGRVELRAVPEPSGVLFECRDTGSGIAPKVLAGLFHLDQRSARQDSEGRLGSGLGLILCQDFVRKMGGELSVSSRVGQGTRFWFTLPTP